MIDDMKVVLDTNVLVAAARSRAGAASALIATLPHPRFALLVSVPLVLEYEAVLKRPAQLQGRNPAQVDAFLDDLCAWAQHVRIHTLWRPQTRDIADEMVLETALNGGAHTLITFNAQDFRIAAARFGLPVWSPGALWQWLQREEKDHG